MQHKKGNISIFVIFVLLASSLLGLLTLTLVQKLLRYQSVAIGYYQSYYSAKAGVETALVLNDTRGIGFSYTIPQSLFSDNFSCTNCIGDTTLVARSSFVQDDYRRVASCTSGFVLGTAETKVVPLFYDNGEGTVYELLTQERTYQSVYQYFNSLSAQSMTRATTTNMILGMFVLSGDQLISDGSFLQEYNGSTQNMLPWFRNAYQAYAANNPILNSPNLQHYLLLANPTGTDTQLCISLEGFHNQDLALGQEIAYIQSVGRFADYRVGLEAVLDARIPQFLLQTYSEL